MKSSTIPSRLLLAGLCTLVPAMTPAMAQGNTDYRALPLVVEHDRAAHPDGIAVAPSGVAYFCRRTLSYGRLHAEILRVEADGRAHHFARLPSAPAGWLSPQATSIGLAVDRGGRVFATHSTFDPASHGVYRIDVRGRVSRLPGTARIALPSGIALDGQGHCYVTDGGQGAIWRGATDGHKPFRSWLETEALRPGPLCPSAIPLPGVQGIVCADPQRLLVANAGRGTILRIDLDAQGRPQVPVEVAAGRALLSVAGLSLLPGGGLLVAVRGGRLLAAPTLLRVDVETGALDPFAPAVGSIHTPRAVAWHPTLGTSVLVVQGRPFDTSMGLDVGLLRLADRSGPTPEGGGRPASVSMTFRDAATDRIRSDGNGSYALTIDNIWVQGDTGKRTMHFDFTQRTACGPGYVPCASPFAGTGDVGNADHVAIWVDALMIDDYNPVGVRFEFVVNNERYALRTFGTVIRSDTDNDQVNDTFVVTSTAIDAALMVMRRERQHQSSDPRLYSVEYPVASYSMPFQFTVRIR